MDNKENKKFLISVESYKNEDLNLFLTLEIKAEEEDQFKAFMGLGCSLNIEDGLCVKDAYTNYLGIRVQKNTIFPENEIDFFDALKHYRVDEYSQIAQELAEQVEDYMNTLFFERVEFQIVIKP